MTIYAVRRAGTKEMVGIATATSLPNLYITADEFVEPATAEFKELYADSDEMVFFSGEENGWSERWGRHIHQPNGWFNVKQRDPDEDGQSLI